MTISRYPKSSNSKYITRFFRVVSSVFLVSSALFFCLSSSFAKVQAAISDVPNDNPIITVTEPVITDMTLNETQVLDYIVHNNASTPLDISKIGGFDSGSRITRDTSVPGNCETVPRLAPNGTCTVRLQIKATTDGQINDKIDFGAGDTVYYESKIKLSIHDISVIAKDSTPITYAFPGETPTDGKLTIKNNSDKTLSVRAQVNKLASDANISIIGPASVEVPKGNTFTFKYSYAPKAKTVTGVQGANSQIDLIYGAATLSVPIRSFFPSYNWFLNLPVNTANYNYLPSSQINSVFRLGQTIYLGTNDGLAISQDEGVSWKTLSVSNGLAANEINKVYVENNHIYAATSKGLSVSLDNGANWTTYTIKDGLGSNIIKSIYAANGKVYAATYPDITGKRPEYVGGVSIGTIAKDGTISWQNFTKGLGSNWVVGVYVSAGKIFAATDDKGLSVSADDGQTWTVYTKESTGEKLASNSVSNVYVASDSRVYVTTYDKGVFVGTVDKYGAINWTDTFNVAHGLGCDRTSDIYVIGSRIFVATYDNPQHGCGLSISSDYGVTWTNYLYPAVSYSMNSVFAVGNKVYAAAYSGFYTGEFQQSGKVEWTAHTAQNDLHNAEALSVYAADNKIYAATYRSGLWVSGNGGNGWDNYTSDQGLTSDFIWGVIAHGDNIYTAASIGGPGSAVKGGVSISTDGGKSWTTPFNTDYVWGIYAPDAGSKVADKIYAATKEGVYIGTQSGTKWDNYKTGLSSNTVFGIFASPNGDTIYAATGNSHTDTGELLTGGVSIGTPTPEDKIAWVNYTTKQGLGSNDVFGIYVVGNTIYAATNGNYTSTETGGGVSIGIKDNTGVWNWTNYTKGLGSNYVKGIYVSGNNVYAATGPTPATDMTKDGGVSVSTDNGKTWHNYTGGLASNDVRGVYATTDKLYAAVFGHGVYATKLNPSLGTK